MLLEGTKENNILPGEWSLICLEDLFGQKEQRIKLWVVRPAWYQETIEEGIEAVMREVVLPHDAPGGMPEYRQVLAGSLLFKAFLEISNNISGRVTEDFPGIGKPLGFK